MQTTFNEHLPWSHRLETGPAECAERLNNNNHNILLAGAHRRVVADHSGLQRGAPHRGQEAQRRAPQAPQ